MPQVLLVGERFHARQLLAREELEAGSAARRRIRDLTARLICGEGQFVNELSKPRSPELS